MHKILWDFEIQTYHLILARRPDQIIINKKKESLLYSGLWVEISFLKDAGLCWQDFFRLHRRKWIRDVTGTNTVFDVEEGNRKLGLFGEKTLVEADHSKSTTALDLRGTCGVMKFPLE